ncbi:MULTISPECIES: uracil-DNA glycosylase [Candidatus Ichthyocystis]|uniref:uracil-DNA glycosylase n=1 Tax=Candidatus Ichthyocystis TaxID=2929841 RepID=UPI000A90E982|nr:MULTISPECIES: uracil-DNA glycosylase [Ichthyocystis]
MNRRERLYYMGIKCIWRSRRTFLQSVRDVEADNLDPEEQTDLYRIDHFVLSQKLIADQWLDLSKSVSECTNCGLCLKRKQAVLGVGDRQAKWLFVGEAPGENEDNIGEPFVGQAGKLLDRMLFALGLDRGKDVYIANAIKCRPPNNRSPTLEEIQTCLPYLRKQIELINPQIIVALGRPATQALLGSVNTRLGSMRGIVFHYAGIPLIVTYHPAYLLRSPLEKAKAWEDLVFARNTLSKLQLANAVDSDNN